MEEGAGGLTMVGTLTGAEEEEEEGADGVAGGSATSHPVFLLLFGGGCDSPPSVSGLVSSRFSGRGEEEEGSVVVDISLLFVDSQEFQ